MKIIVKNYSPRHLEETVTVLSDAFVSNPLHESAFGLNRLDQNRTFFRLGLRHMFVGSALVAMHQNKVCGYAHYNVSPQCLPAPEELPIAAATLLKPLGDAIPRVIRWFARWCHLDPDEPHIHLGPIGVTPTMQGKGVGTALMTRYVEHLEREKAAGYLETDRATNVEFYQKFGFRVRHQERLINTQTWYMWRANKA